MLRFLSILFLITFFSSIAIADEVKIIDGRSQNSIESEYKVDPSEYIFTEESKDLFEIVDFKNIKAENNKKEQNNDLVKMTNFKTIISTKDDNIKNHRGHIVILHFWATWCGYCLDEMKSLDNLASILQKKEIEDIDIIPISVDADNYSIIQDFYKEMNIKNLPIYQDKENKYLSLLGRTTLPSTFIIGKNGKQVAVANSSVPWNNEEIVNYLETLL